MPQRFIQLSKDECHYLLTLIQEMDADTAFTAKQRSYTIPKLEKIQIDPRTVRLAFQDIEYLLDLIEDDELEHDEQIRLMTQSSLEEIRELQQASFKEKQSIEDQRESRRLKRLSPEKVLQSHFEQTSRK
jgi:hypothetical protein